MASNGYEKCTIIWTKYIQGHLQPCGNYIINTLNRNKAINYKAKQHEDNLYSVNGNNIILNKHLLTMGVGRVSQ